VQRLRRLASRRAARWEEGRFVAEGPLLLEEALRAEASVEAVYIDFRSADDHSRRLAEQARLSGATVLEVQPGVLERAAATVTPQPVAAIVVMNHSGLDSLAPTGSTVVCAGLQDPGNVGTVVRSAAAAGGWAMVFCTGGVDVYNPKTVRASAGALFHLPLVCGPQAETVLGHLGRLGVPRLGAVARGGRVHDQQDWRGAHALVLGSESHGLAAPVDALLDGRVTIPMAASTESLNVAMAATVILFEADRQRRAEVGTGS